MRALLKYPGSKWSIADWIISHFPEHHSYLEPFLGSGAVLFNKSRSHIETVNDLDGNVVNLFEWIKKDPEKLAHEIYWTPYARQVYEDAFATVPEDSLEKAINFYIRLNKEDWEMRTPESKEKLMNIIQMRLDGYSLQQIADKYGVTKQCIQQQLSIIAGNAKPRPRGIDERVVYPNLAKWMIDNKVSKYKLSEIVGMASKSTTGINAKLYGERDFSMSEIKKLLEITGQTFEYLFEEKSKEEAT